MLKQKKGELFSLRFHLKGQKCKKKLIRLNTFLEMGLLQKNRRESERKPLKLKERSNKFTSNIFFFILTFSLLTMSSLSSSPSLKQSRSCRLIIRVQRVQINFFLGEKHDDNEGHLHNENVKESDKDVEEITG